MQTIKSIRFRRSHQCYTATDAYSFPAHDADRYIAAGLAVEVGSSILAEPVLPNDVAVAAAVAGKASGSRARKITKG